MPKDPYGGHDRASPEGQEEYWGNFWDEVGEFGVLEYIWDYFFGDDPEDDEQDSG